MKPKKVLIGKWTWVGQEVVADDTCREIENSISERLQKVATRADGWVILYEDAEGTHWELSHPEGEWQGGGPPMLPQMDAEQVRELYPGVRLEFPEGQTPQRNEKTGGGGIRHLNATPALRSQSAEKGFAPGSEAK